MTISQHFTCFYEKLNCFVVMINLLLLPLLIKVIAKIDIQSDIYCFDTATNIGKPG